MSPPRHRLAMRRVHHGRIVKLDIETITAPDGSTLELEIIRHPGAAAVLPVVAEPDGPGVLLLHQYRHAAGGPVWEIPAGVLEPGETPLQCARRELLEEAGARAKALVPLTTVLTTPGFTDEQIHLFAAEVETVREPQPDPDEFFEIRKLGLSSVLEMIHEGEIRDAKTIVAILYAVRFGMVK